MTTNITTLALNLLISERLDHRNIFADRIVNLLCESNDDSENGKALKADFLSAIAQCIENPNSEVRNHFYQLAQYFNVQINGAQTNLVAAA